MTRRILWLWLLMVLPLIGVSSANAETLTLTTYFPAPFGAFDRLRLYPRDAFPAGYCNNDTLGTFFVDQATNTLQMCSDPAIGFQPLGSLWIQNGDDLYPTQTAINPNLRVGIGTSEPMARLHIDEGTIPVNWASFNWHLPSNHPADADVIITAENPSIALIGQEDSARSGSLRFIDVTSGSGDWKDMWALWRETSIAPRQAKLHFMYIDSDSGPAAKEMAHGHNMPAALTLTRDRRLGIGTSAPQVQLDVAGDFKASGHAAFGANASVSPDSVLNINELMNPPAGQGSFAFEAYVYNTAPFNVAAGFLSGGAFMAANEATTGASLGQYTGAYGGVFKQSTGVMGKGIGLFGESVKETVGPISSAYSAIVDITNQSAAGVIANLYGVHIENSENLGTINNTTGIYINSSLNSGARTQPPFGIYSRDANARTYFAGEVGLNVESPTVRLDVNGSIRTRPAAAGPVCDVSTRGMMYYDAVTHKLKGCAGAIPVWVELNTP